MSAEQHTDFDPNTYMINDTLTLREYQKKNLELAEYFDRFCRDHNIVYYLCGGACIGALRHKGFIPWDCDVDVFMLRKDYERLEALWNKYADTDHYSYDRTTENYNMHAQCAGIKDNYTTYIRTHNQNDDMNHGLMLDIIPLDALSNNWFKRQWQKVCGVAFCLFNAQRLPNQQGGFVRKVSGIILGIIRSPKLRYKIWKSAENYFSKFDPEKCTYLGELTTGFHNINIRFPKGWFDKPKDVPFENIVLMGPTEIEKYTEHRYPNFMQYPPVEEQVPKMQPAFVDMNTPYIKYKGIKYCVK